MNMKIKNHTILALGLLTISICPIQETQTKENTTEQTYNVHATEIQTLYSNFFGKDVNIDITLPDMLEATAQLFDGNGEYLAAESCRSLKSQNNVYDLEPNASEFVEVIWDNMRQLPSETQELLEELGPEQCEMRLREIQAFALMRTAFDPNESEAEMPSWAEVMDKITDLLGDYDKYKALTQDLKSIRNKKITTLHIAKAGMYHSMGYELTTLDNDLGAILRVLKQHSDLIPPQIRNMSSDKVDHKQLKNSLFRVVKMMKMKK